MSTSDSDPPLTWLAISGSLIKIASNPFGRVIRRYSFLSFGGVVKTTGLVSRPTPGKVPGKVVVVVATMLITVALSVRARGLQVRCRSGKPWRSKRRLRNATLGLNDRHASMQSVRQRSNAAACYSMLVQANPQCSNGRMCRPSGVKCSLERTLRKLRAGPLTKEEEKVHALTSLAVKSMNE